MEKVRFGIVGVGGMGSGHASTMKNIEEVELTAVCDVDKKTSDRVAADYKVRGFTDYKELIDSGLVDAIIVATPHYYHPPVSIYAMKKKIHVLSEKPIAVTVKAADEMVAAAKANKVKFAVMYQTRSTPEYQAAKKIVSEGRLGKIYRTLCIDSEFRSQAYYDSAGWRGTWKGEGGGVLINQAPHKIDVFMSLGDLPNKVLAWTNTRRHKIEVEDEASALLSYKDGATGFYHASTNEFPSTDYLELCGEKGKLVMNEGRVRFWTLEKPLQEFSDTTPQMWDQPKAHEEEVPLEKRESGHGAIIRNLARAILYSEPLLSPGEEGLMSVEFINAVILSGKLGKPVKIPVDRKAYEAFIERMKRTSKPKRIKEAKRITDPRISRA
ncbi:MAG: Gfo/Idh/MocA family protein [Thermoproteota archaeon]